MSHGTPEETALRRARAVFVGSIMITLALTAIGGQISASGTLQFLVMPAALAGVVGPAVGYRLYLSGRDRGATDSLQDACRRFTSTGAVALAATQAGALLGIVAYSSTDRPEALIGVFTHVLLAGAIWPTTQQLEMFLACDSGEEKGEADRR